MDTDATSIHSQTQFELQKRSGGCGLRIRACVSKRSSEGCRCHSSATRDKGPNVWQQHSQAGRAAHSVGLGGAAAGACACSIGLWRGQCMCAPGNGGCESPPAIACVTIGASLQSSGVAVRAVSRGGGGVAAAGATWWCAFAALSLTRRSIAAAAAAPLARGPRAQRPAHPWSGARVFA